MKCPDCNGTGKTGPVHINTGFNPITGGCSGYWEKESSCHRCKGACEITAEMAEWIKAGKLLKQERINRGESLFNAAARLGISTSHLSAIECGRRSIDIGLDKCPATEPR